MRLALIGSRPEVDNRCASRLRVEINIGIGGVAWMPLADCRFWPSSDPCVFATPPNECGWWWPGEFGEFRCFAADGTFGRVGS